MWLLGTPCRLFMFYAMVVTELAHMSFVVWHFVQEFARSPKLNSETVIQGLYMEFHISSGIFGLNLILYHDELITMLNQTQELIVHFKGRTVFVSFLLKCYAVGNLDLRENCLEFNAFLSFVTEISTNSLRWL